MRVLIAIVAAMAVVAGSDAAGSGGKRVGLLGVAQPEAWKTALSNAYECRTLERAALTNLAGTVDVLVIGETPLTIEEALAIEAFVRGGGAVIAYGTAGYLEGKFNLTALLKCGKYMMSLPLIYPAYSLEDDFVPLAKWLAENGADGLDVHSLPYVLGSKNEKGPKARPYKGDKPEYDRLLRETILPGFDGWKKSMAPVPLGLPPVPKAVWTSIYYQMNINSPTHDPEALANTVTGLGFNAVSFSLVHYGVVTYDSRFRQRDKRVPADYLEKLASACKRHNLQLWGTIINQGIGYLKQHPNEAAVSMDGKKSTMHVCPRVGREFYAWQRNSVEEALKRYPSVNCLLIDEPFFAMNCAACRAAFKAKAGREPSGNDPEFTVFREDSHIEFFFRPLAEAVKRVNPLCALVLAMPISDSSLYNAAVNLSKYADAGLQIWEPEFPRYNEFSRGGRRKVNAEKSLVYHTPQRFEFTQMSVAGTRDTESMYKDMAFRGRGVQVDVFNGAEVAYWMTGTNSVQWPGIVRANKGRTLYTAADPLAAPALSEYVKQALREMTGATAAQSGSVYHAGWPQVTRGRITASPALVCSGIKGGRAVAVIDSENYLFVWNQRGESLPGWPVHLEGLARGSSPAAADLNGDGADEIVAPGQNRVYAFKLDATALSGWPRVTEGDLRATPALADADGDGKLDVVIATTSGKVYVWNGAGESLSGWPQTAADAIEASLAVADIDGDGRPDVVAATESGKVHVWTGKAAPLPGWPQSANFAVFSSPSVADVDGDGKPEIVAGCNSGKVFVWRRDGSLLPGWPQRAEKAVLSSPALADVDGDRRLEIAVGSEDGRLYVWKHNGALLPGWPQNTGMNIESSPAVADVDGDKRLEVIAGSWDKSVYIWKHDGALLPGWPQHLPCYVYASPAAGDIDGDGLVELAIAGDDGKVYIWDLEGRFAPEQCPWPMFRRGSDRTGVAL